MKAVELEFKEINSERYRTYEWSNGFEVTIFEPTHLNLSRSGGHGILDKSGKSHYIPSGWKHLYWEVLREVHILFHKLKDTAAYNIIDHFYEHKN